MIHTNSLLDKIWNCLAGTPLEMGEMELLNWWNWGGKTCHKHGWYHSVGSDQIKMRQGTFISLLLAPSPAVMIVPSNSSFLMLFARHLVTTRKVPDMLIILGSPLLCLRNLFFLNSLPLAMVDLFSVPEVLLSCRSLYPLISVTCWRFYDDNWGSHWPDYRGRPV